jgi:hypothetical protein
MKAAVGADCRQHRASDIAAALTRVAKFFLCLRQVDDTRVAQVVDNSAHLTIVPRGKLEIRSPVLVAMYSANWIPRGEFDGCLRKNVTANSLRDS